jgi:hypothetical protein
MLKPRARGGRDGFEIEPATVVPDADFDAVTAHGGADGQARTRGFAGAHARLRRFDAVIDGVAHQVQERAAYALDDRAIELEVGAFDRELDRLVLRGRQIAHHPLQAFAGFAEGQHAHAMHLAFERRRRALEVAEVFGDRAAQARKIGFDVLERFGGGAQQALAGPLTALADHHAAVAGAHEREAPRALAEVAEVPAQLRHLLVQRHDLFAARLEATPRDRELAAVREQGVEPAHRHAHGRALFRARQRRQAARR